MKNSFVSLIWFPKSKISWAGQLEPVGYRDQHIAGDQTRRPAAVWTLNILLPKFHAFLTIGSEKV